ncbi:MAG TPA: DegT/DnrJ/EryC1/StrS family aminotransferase, partial [bacterium]|nr:DegT/DnrJ/EryC1/StrS family aminotransferase [bacterium]
FGRGKNLSLGTGGLLLFKSGMWSYALEDELKRLPSPPFYAPFADLLRYQLIHFFSRPGNYGFFNPLLGFFKASSPPLSFPLRKPSGRVARMGGGLFHEVLRSQLRVVYNQNFIYQSLRNIEGIGLFEPPAESRPVLTRFPVLFNKRAERLKAQRALKRAGFDSSAFYIKPVHHHFPDLGHSMSDFPKACYLASHLLTIPVHHQLAKDDLLKMVKIIKEVISDQEQVERGE